MSLECRGAVVTGGGRGIGAAIAESLVAAGARVVLASRTETEAEGVAATLRAKGHEAAAVRCDVAEEDDVARLAAEARHRLGAVDVLVNAAGVSASAPLRKIARADWDRMLAVNATGTFLCTQAMAPGMAERGFGRIVNLASIAGLRGARYVAHYSAAKHAVVGFTRAVALELEGSGVTVNAVCPGYVDTPMTRATLANVQARTGLAPEAALAAVLATTGQERLIAPAEVADAVVALCAEDAKATGQTIVIGASARHEIVNPESLGKPQGFSHGVLARKEGRLLFVAGQVGWDSSAPGEPAPFAAQFAIALDKVLTVVRAAGGSAEDVARLTVYVTDLSAYRASRKLLGETWRTRFGRHYPAMALVEVKDLVDAGALVEVEATAVIGGSP